VSNPLLLNATLSAAATFAANVVSCQRVEEGRFTPGADFQTDKEHLVASETQAVRRPHG
jgi:hypothetical protein